MYTATRSKEEKTSEISMIEMSDAVVYPRAMMIHLHYTPNTHIHTGHCINKYIQYKIPNKIQQYQEIHLSKLQFINSWMAICKSKTVKNRKTKSWEFMMTKTAFGHIFTIPLQKMPFFKLPSFLVIFTHKQPQFYFRFDISDPDFL